MEDDSVSDQRNCEMFSTSYWTRLNRKDFEGLDLAIKITGAAVTQEIKDEILCPDEGDKAEAHALRICDRLCHAD